ncbi:MAG: efflux RND transporter periplasmic adaptor subunit [Acidobacteriia bacterium]|nr:efflux RND transporter periplasmic adaptor subunit [Terriglobia bacterium]
MIMDKTKTAPRDSRFYGIANHTGWWPGGLMGIALVAGLLFSGCGAKEAPEEAPTVTVQVGAAENEAIQLKISADATLYPRDQAAIVPKVSAPVKKFYVNRGSRVKAGQLLAELENRDLTGAQQKSQGGYQQAQATYDMQVQKVAQDLKLAKQTMDAQQRIYDSRQALYKEGAVSAKDVEDAGIALTQARNAYDLAQKQSDLKVAEAQLLAAKGDTASAEAQLSYSRIVSPINGVVTDRPFYAGETAPSGSPIITVMDLSQVIARAHISQEDASHLKAGDEATISVPGQGAAVKAKVTLVSPALDPNSTTVEVWVQAANSGGRLKPGVSARVTMIGETVPHAIVAPVAALLTSTDGVTSMIVLDTDNKPHKKKVKVGIRDAGDVQITDGLQGGERVVTVGAFELDKLDDMSKVVIQVQAPKMPEEEEEDQ